MANTGTPYTLGQQGLSSLASNALADYTSRFAPLESTVLTPPRTYEDVTGEAGARVGTAFSTMPGMLARRRAGFGTTASADQVQSEQRRTSLQRAIANADAQTRAIQSLKGDRAAKASMAFDSYATDMDAARGMLGQVANEEVSREQQYQAQYQEYLKQKAARNGGILGLAGTLIGFAAGGPLGAQIGGAIGGSLG